MQFSNFPFYHEVAKEYASSRRENISRDEVVAQLKTSHTDAISIGMEDDGIIFYIALADAQFKLRELSSEVALAAQKALDLEEKYHNLSISQKEISKRRTNYAAAPMPENVKIRAKKDFQCKWNTGDTFAYRLSGDKAEQLNIAGFWIIIRTVGQQQFTSHQVFPIVTLSIWKSHQKPTNEINPSQLPLLRLASGRMFAPANTYEYRALLLLKSQKQVDNLNLHYLGNWGHIVMPNDEVVFSKSGETYMILSETLDSDLCICYRNDMYYTQGVARQQL